MSFHCYDIQQWNDTLRRIPNSHCWLEFAASTIFAEFRNDIEKRARYNNTIGDESKQSDIQNRKGTVVRFRDYPTTSALRSKLERIVGVPLVGELNHYFDPISCGIDWHGDEERKIVIGARLGRAANGFPLKFLWYQNDRPFGYEGRIRLNAGDVYVMSEKAVGSDWKNDAIPTLRHAAGRDTCVHARVKRKAGETTQGVKYL